jgi:transposase-like protein
LRQQQEGGDGQRKCNKWRRQWRHPTQAAGLAEAQTAVGKQLEHSNIDNKSSSKNVVFRPAVILLHELVQFFYFLFLSISVLQLL